MYRYFLACVVARAATLHTQQWVSCTRRPQAAHSSRQTPQSMHRVAHRVNKVSVGPFGARVRPGSGSCEARARCMQPKAKRLVQAAVLL